MTLDLKPQLGLLHMIEQKENGCLNQKNIFDNVIAAYLLNPLKNEYPYEDIAKDYSSLMIPSRVDLLGKLSYDLAMDEKPEEFLKKTLMVRVFEVDEAENRLVLSARELLKEQADAEKLAKTQQITVGSVLEGTVESLQTYGAFIDLGDGISGLVHISQISQKRIKSPKAVLSVGDNVTVKVIKNEDGKLSLSMKALMEVPEEEEEEVIDYELPEAEEATTTLGSLFKNIKLD